MREMATGNAGGESLHVLTGNSFLFFARMLGVSGLAIGVFETGALALIGDISTSTAQHTSIMNTAEGFFGIGPGASRLGRFPSRCSRRR